MTQATTFPELEAELLGSNGVVPEHLRSERRKQLVIVWVIRILLVVAVLGGWQLAYANKLLNPLAIGDPTGIGHDFVTLLHSSGLLADIGTTLTETALGFLIASGSAIVIAYLFMTFPLAHRALRPAITGLNSLPRIALAPLFILWFGLGENSKIALIISFVFFIVLVNTVAAISTADRDHELLSRSLGFNERQRLWKFVTPAAMPVIVATLELALTYSFLGAIIGEMLGGANGLGVRLELYINQVNPNGYFAVLLVIVVITVAIVQIMHAVTGRWLKWHQIELRGLRA